MLQGIIDSQSDMKLLCLFDEQIKLNNLAKEIEKISELQN